MSNKTLIWGVVFISVGLMLFAGVYNRNRGISPGPARIHGGTPDPGAAAGVSGATGTGGATRQNQAPDFSLTRLDGGTITLSEFRGKKPVVVDFWASWCPNCRRDMPKMSAMYPKYKDQVEIIGINLQESEGTARRYIESAGIQFPIALDPFGNASSQYGIRYTNTHFLVDKTGNIIREIPGDIRESDIQWLIENG